MAPSFRLVPTVAFAAAAGGLGWGIRGQFGHETGAMVPGLLVSLVLVLLAAPRATSLRAARAVALATVAFSFGGSMTYGQTIGLTQDAPLVGNWSAFAWGMLGLALKGALWIGFGGLFLGMGLGGRRYRPLEVGLLLGAMIAALLVGVALLNEPFEPAARQLPAIYFSDHWAWEPGADLVPRRERWGGLLAALLVGVSYVAAVKKDRLARDLALAGSLAGGLGFSLGQCVQAWDAWNPEWIGLSVLAPLAPYVNWWKAMEVTFGLVLGGGLGLALWLRRDLVRDDEPPDVVSVGVGSEVALLVVHVAALVAWNFGAFRPLDAVAEHAIPMGLIPMVAVLGGRYWPYLLALPVTALPIAGKTLRNISYREPLVPEAWGWVLLVVLPLAATTTLAVWLARRGRRDQDGRAFTRTTLLASVALYLALSFAELEFPGPWAVPTEGTLIAVVFGVLGVALAGLALRRY